MTAKQKNQILGVALLAFCIIAITVGVVQNKALRENHVLGVAHIQNHSSGGRGNAGGIWIDYSINVNGINYKSSSRYLTSDIKIEVLKQLRNKSLPVLYNPSNPSISILMFLPKDFQRKGYTFPDSLRWILPYTKR
jgi:hypothetical protein